MLLEPAIGHVKFAAIYGVSLLTGSLGALLVSPHVLTVGASGAVFGVMGAAAVELWARKVPLMQSGVGGLILINLVFSFTVPDISWGGHIGGLVGGVLAALVIQLGDRYRSQALAVAGCAAIAVAAWRARSPPRRPASSKAPARPARSALVAPEYAQRGRLTRTRALQPGSTSRASPGALARARGEGCGASSSRPSTSRGPGREK